MTQPPMAWFQQHDDRDDAGKWSGSSAGRQVVEVSVDPSEAPTVRMRRKPKARRRG